MASPASRLTRRRLVLSATAVAGLHALPAGAASLVPTPPQTTGPFYPLELPLDSDNDLVQIAGRPERAAGTILHLGGRVLDPDGRPVRGAPGDLAVRRARRLPPSARPRGPADPNFQGFGSTAVAEDGAYRFRTIEPVPYPGRTPHIHFRILAPGLEPLVTQMYVAGQPLNSKDGLYQRLGERAALVTVALEPAPDLEPSVKSGAKRGLFDIVLGPNGVPRDA